MFKINKNNLKLTRIKLGLTKAEVSRLANISHNTLSRIEKGEHSPNPATIGKIAKALNIEIEKLIDIQD
ncbi:helix-turn-helix transcriptional regulator [Clostridium sp. AWRP]|uniref:helix-turn-helix transcriptional regulator n=1 Tax=Clostridium sp. AWRP TaxID=2212991 RepID=UPI000FD79DCE|nr:helix-turn-helix transcriptional regulator [Clostridium sp. AWRP]AZV58948.1 helix-turn-helix domain-containing protein [Clostridium sp. AWRP]